MDMIEGLLKVGLPLAAVVGIAWAVRKAIPDTSLTGSGCGGG